MKRKAKVCRRDGPIPETNESTVEPCNSLAAPRRSSIEQVDEHKTGSIESVAQTGAENGVAGFIEPEETDAAGAG